MNWRRSVGIAFAYLAVATTVLVENTGRWNILEASPTQISQAAARGESRTLLTDGRVLVIGGLDESGHPQAIAVIQDSKTMTATRLSGSLNNARAWHTATMLPNGKVLILGGVGADGKV